MLKSKVDKYSIFNLLNEFEIIEDSDYESINKLLNAESIKDKNIGEALVEIEIKKEI